MADSDWIEVADRIWMRRYDPLDVNVTVIDGDLGRVVVDTRGSLQQGLELRHDLMSLGAEPVLAVVNTHHHFDHVYGNEVFSPSPIVGHVRAAEILTEEGERRRTELYESLPEYVHPEIEETTITPPSTLVDHELILTLGDRHLRIAHLGRGHTDNDLVIEIQDAGTVVAGDLIEESGPPSMGDAYPLEWPETVTRLLEMDAATFVPGHGVVMTAEDVGRQRDELQQLADLLTRQRRGELTVAEVIERSPLPSEHTETAIRRP